MTIGDKKQILFELNELDSSNELRNLNFFLGGILISNESAYIPTYLASLERFIELLTKAHFANATMDELTAEQRSDKLINERESDEPQFFRHLFQLDETINQYTIFVFQSNQSTDFVWFCWDEHNCNSEHELNQIYSTRISTVELTSWLNKLATELKK